VSDHQDIDFDELLDDPELERLHADRLAAMQQEAEKRVKLERQGHGKYTEVVEMDFLEVVTKTDRVVCHFFHRWGGCLSMYWVGRALTLTETNMFSGQACTVCNCFWVHR
jgi:hypothetical protein